jgi:DNA topoisomerase III
LRSIVELQQSHNEWGNYAKKLLDGSFREPRKGPNNDQAHPPIHPTKFVNNLVGDEKSVYEFICRHYLASCSDGKFFFFLLFVYFFFFFFF